LIGNWVDIRGFFTPITHVDARLKKSLFFFWNSRPS